MNYKNKTDDELVKEAEGLVKGAEVEMMRRLKDSIQDMSNKTDFYSGVLVALTLILAFIAVMQLFVSVEAMKSKPQIIIFATLAFLFVFLIARDFKKEKDKIEKPNP